ncbi:hypothetical protein [Thioalkalivibrio thiocyanoxidans]|uniref:hypothetical protein n=1 Tax=Thioalkalivibrio thiocyanoxidans TaxID=152475 RepID=UPI00037C5BF3|nr:hypothetical protein [Thioalkalivibrio thiocyanoxidans]
MKRPFLFSRVDLIRQTHEITADGLRRGLGDKAIHALAEEKIDVENSVAAEIDDLRADLSSLAESITATEHKLSEEGVKALREGIDKAVNDVLEQNAEKQEHPLAELKRRQALLDAECLINNEKLRRHEFDLAKLEAKAEEADRSYQAAFQKLTGDEQVKRLQAQKMQVELESEKKMLSELEAYTQTSGGQ